MSPPALPLARGFQRQYEIHRAYVAANDVPLCDIAIGTSVPGSSRTCVVWMARSRRLVRRAHVMDDIFPAQRSVRHRRGDRYMDLRAQQPRRRYAARVAWLQARPVAHVRQVARGTWRFVPLESRCAPANVLHDPCYRRT